LSVSTRESSSETVRRQAAIARRYRSTAVRLVVCYANCDGSFTPPALNVNDFICFQSRFAAGCQ